MTSLQAQARMIRHLRARAEAAEFNIEEAQALIAELHQQLDRANAAEASS